MIFSCAVWFSKNIFKIPELSLPPCRSERPDRGGPCWLLKLRWMGRKGYKLKRSFIGRFVGLVVPVQETFQILILCTQYTSSTPRKQTRKGEEPEKGTQLPHNLLEETFKKVVFKFSMWYISLEQTFYKRALTFASFWTFKMHGLERRKKHVSF